MRKFLVAIIFLMSILNISFLFYRTQNSFATQITSATTVLSEIAEPEFSEPKSEVIPTFVRIPKFRNIEDGSIYGDVLSHSNERPFGDAHGRATNVHETAHGIHSYLRNKYIRELGKRVNGFYCLEGRACIIEEPAIRKSDANRFVPQKLRSYRWSTYMTGQMAWDDTPLYIYDEWVCYILGGKTNIDDVQNGRYKDGWTDGVSGCLDFSIYATAICMAVKQNDPQYWENNEQFKNFTIWMLKEAYRTYMVGHTMKEFKWPKQDQLLNNLLTSREGEEMRNFMREYLEGDSHWLSTDLFAFKVIFNKSHQTKDFLPLAAPGCFHCKEY